MPDLVLGLLALHGRQLAGEQERRASEIDGRLGARGRSGFDRSGRLGRREVGGREALDHGLDGEVVVPRLAAGRQPQQPGETQFGGREPADVAEPAEDPFRSRLVERKLARPGGTVSTESTDPGVGLPVGMEGQGLEELESEGLGLEPTLLDPGDCRTARRWAQEQPPEDVDVNGVDVESGELRHGEPTDAVRVDMLLGVGGLDEPDEVARAQGIGGMGLEQEFLDEREGIRVAGEEAVAEPFGRQLAGAEMLVEHPRGQLQPVPRLEQSAPCLQADLLARIACQQQVGGQTTDGGIVCCRPGGRARPRAGRGRGCGRTRRHRRAPHPTGNRTAGAPPRAGRATGRRPARIWERSSAPRRRTRPPAGYPRRRAGPPSSARPRGARRGSRPSGNRRRTGGPGRSGRARAVRTGAVGSAARATANARSFSSVRPLRRWKVARS